MICIAVYVLYALLCSSKYALLSCGVLKQEAIEEQCLFTELLLKLFPSLSLNLWCVVISTSDLLYLLFSQIIDFSILSFYLEPIPLFHF